MELLGLGHILIQSQYQSQKWYSVGGLGGQMEIDDGQNLGQEHTSSFSWPLQVASFNSSLPSLTEKPPEMDLAVHMASSIFRQLSCSRTQRKWKSQSGQKSQVSLKYIHFDSLVNHVW